MKLLQSLEHRNIIQYLDAFLSGQEDWSSSKSGGGGKVSAASASNQSDLIIVLEWAEAEISSASSARPSKSGAIRGAHNLALLCSDCFSNRLHALKAHHAS